MDLDQAVGHRDHRERSCELLLDDDLNVISYGPYFVEKDDDGNIVATNSASFVHELESCDPSALCDELDELVVENYRGD